MKKQKGFVVLLSSVVLMLIISLGAFIGAKGSILEQQTANAMYRTEEAFQYAEAGMREMWALLKLDPSKASSNQSITVAGKYTAAYNATTATITSTGTGSGNATRTVTQRILTAPGTGGGPAAMTALGNIELTGSASATDVKSGGTFSGNSTYKDAEGVTQNTTVTQNTNEFQIALLDHNDQNLVDSSGKIITRSMTTDEYFMYFFSGLCPIAKNNNSPTSCKSEARQSVINNSSKGYFCEKDCASKTEDEKLIIAYNSGKRIFWLDSGGIDHSQNMGSANDPVLIFVMNIADGSTAAKINANSTIYGILYVDIMDSLSTVNCSCRTDAKVSSIIQIDNPESPIWNYSRYTSDGAKVNNKYPNLCYGTGNPKICSQLLTKTINGRTYTTTVTTKDTERLVDSSTVTITFNKINTYTWGDFSSIGLNSTTDARCTVSACDAAINTATKTCTSTSPTPYVVGDSGICSFPAVAVSGSNNTPVQIEVVGTWTGSGTGNTVIQGAAITSGNYKGAGNVSFIKNSTAITNLVLNGIGGAAFQSAPPTVSLAPNGWSDLN